MIRVFLIDDHAIVRYGLAQLLAGERDFELCGQSGDARTALASVIAARPQVVILDVALGTANGIDLIPDIKDRTGAAVLVISMHDELLYAERSLRAGASGYVMKHAVTDEIVRAIRVVTTGEIFVSEAVSSRLVQRLVAGGTTPSSPLETLSDRELHVLRLMGQGLGTRAIAEQLHISIKTVESYRARLKDKIQLKTGTELLRFAVRWAEQQTTED